MTNRIVNRIVNQPVWLALYGVAVAFWPMLASGFSLMQVDPADTRHLNYVLEHDWRWMTGQLPSLWDPAFFFPVRGVATYTELMLGVTPFYGVWRLFGAQPDTAFQLWMLTVALLNYATAWLLFRRALAFEPLGASGAAFLVSFGNMRLAELNHQHLLPHFFTFLAVHALVRLVTGAQRPRFWVFAFFASVVLQLYACLTLGWFLGFALGIALLWSAAFKTPREALLALVRKQWIALAWGALGAALALWPLLPPYRAAGRALGARDWGETYGYLPQAHSWFFMGPHNWLAGWMTDLWGDGPRLGLGLVTTVAVLYAFWHWRPQPWLKVAGLTALTIVLTVTLYRGRLSPWQLVAAVVPGAEGLRAVSRIGLVLLIPAAAALATFLQRTKPWLAWAVFVVCIVEQGARVPDTYPKEQLRKDVAQVAAAIPKDCRAFFYAPVGQPKYDEKTQLDAMWAGLELGIPTANGYSSHFPKDWTLLEHGLAPGADSAALQNELARWEVRHFLVPGTVCFVAPGRSP